MKLLGLLLLFGFAAGTPVYSPTCTPDVRMMVHFGKGCFHEKFKKYTSQHDIIDILVPLNGLNYFHNLSKNDDDFNVTISVVFFIEGDYKDDGTFDSKGLFVLNTKTGESTKLLDNGVDFTSVQDNNKNVYFAAPDGIYTYNPETNRADKYESIANSIIGIAKARTRDVIYALTAENELYRITENGKKKELVDQVRNAQQIVMGHTDKLFYYNDKKEVYSIDFENNVHKIEGLPENPNAVSILRPTLLSQENDVLREHIPVYIDAKMYMVDGTCASKPDEVTNSYIIYPTVLGFEALYSHFIGYNKTIYEFYSRFYEDDVNDDVLNSFEFSIVVNRNIYVHV